MFLPQLKSRTDNLEMNTVFQYTSLVSVNDVDQMSDIRCVNSTSFSYQTLVKITGSSAIDLMYSID